MADIFAVVADHTRRELLGILLRRRSEGIASGDASVSELVAELALSQPTVSKHLKVLREAGLVTVREKGQHRYYRLEPDGLSGVGAWVGPFLPPVDAGAGNGAATGAGTDGTDADGTSNAVGTDTTSPDGTGEAAADAAAEADTTGATGSEAGAPASASTGPVPGAALAGVLGRVAADVSFRLRRS